MTTTNKFAAHLGNGRFLTVIRWLLRGTAELRELGPYAAIEFLMPGGSLILLGVWLIRRHRRRNAASPVRSSSRQSASPVGEFGALDIA